MVIIFVGFLITEEEIEVEMFNVIFLQLGHVSSQCYAFKNLIFSRCGEKFDRGNEASTFITSSSYNENNTDNA